MLKRFGLLASDGAPPNSRWGLIEIRRYGFRDIVLSEMLSEYKAERIQKGAAR
jgi:hypothetical protein